MNELTRAYHLVKIFGVGRFLQAIRKTPTDNPVDVNVENTRQHVYALLNIPANWTYNENALRVYVRYTNAPVRDAWEAMIFLFDLHHNPAEMYALQERSAR